MEQLFLKLLLQLLHRQFSGAAVVRACTALHRPLLVGWQASRYGCHVRLQDDGGPELLSSAGCEAEAAGWYIGHTASPLHSASIRRQQQDTL